VDTIERKKKKTVTVTAKTPIPLRTPRNRFALPATNAPMQYVENRPVKSSAKDKIWASILQNEARNFKVEIFIEQMLLLPLEAVYALLITTASLLWELFRHR